MKKKILFLTGTRADFGKIKSLLLKTIDSNIFNVEVFITGMHMLSKYGNTYDEIDKCNFPHTFKYINQNHSDTMDTVLGKTISGLSDYVKESSPDMIVVHGDRVEALAGAIVGSLNNILVSHIEGGEVSGTVDEIIRHTVSKMSHLHFVSNDISRKRLIQLGEIKKNIFVIGSPDMDIMSSDTLPTLNDVKHHYNILFDSYGILLYHPVTTELDSIRQHTKILVESLIKSEKKYIVIYPNNDPGSELILEEYGYLIDSENFLVFPSIRFEYFLVLMKYSEFMIGNSSAGIREAPYFGVPSINLGSRQNNRSNAETIINSDYEIESILNCIEKVQMTDNIVNAEFGHGESDTLFINIIKNDEIWESSAIQKYFVDL